MRRHNGARIGIAVLVTVALSSGSLSAAPLCNSQSVSCWHLVFQMPNSTKERYQLRATSNQTEVTIEENRSQSSVTYSIALPRLRTEGPDFLPLLVTIKNDADASEQVSIKFRMPPIAHMPDRYVVKVGPRRQISDSVLAAMKQDLERGRMTWQLFIRSSFYMNSELDDSIIPDLSYIKFAACSRLARTEPSYIIFSYSEDMCGSGTPQAKQKELLEAKGGKWGLISYLTSFMREEDYTSERAAAVSRTIDVLQRQFDDPGEKDLTDGHTGIVGGPPFSVSDKKLEYLRKLLEQWSQKPSS